MLLALSWALLLAVVVVARITFPLELEWMEGGSLHHALRLLRGEPLYSTPSVDFVPFLYTPLYPALLAFLAGIGLPLGLFLGRAVSVISGVAIACTLWRLVAAENKPVAHRAAAVGLFLGGYVLCFRWYDIARADTMMFALLLWGVSLIRTARSGWRRPLLAGVLVALAFWTKQTAAVLIIASGLGGVALGLRGRVWVLARYTLTVAIAVLGGLYVGDLVTDGWLWTYIYELHQSHAFNHERFEKKTWGMLLHAGPFVGALALFLVSDDIGRLVVRLRKSGGASSRLGALFDRSEAAAGRRFWAVMAIAALLVSALGYSTQWAEPNAFMPAVIFGAAYLGVALPVGGRRELCTLGLVAAQLLFAAVVEPFYQPIQDRGPQALSESYRWQDPGLTMPSATARATANELRANLRSSSFSSFSSSSSSSSNKAASVGSEVFALQRPWWNVIAGGPGHVASMGLSDVPKSDRARLRVELGAALRSDRFAELWFEGEPPSWLRAALVGRYRLSERRLGDARVRPLTGYMSEAGMVTAYRAPQLHLVRTGRRSPPAGAAVIADFEGGVLAPGFRRQGSAFSSRPHAAIVGDLPVLGPHGGVALIGSARRRSALRLTGSLETPLFTVPRGGSLELLVGVGGGSQDGLGLTILDVDDSSRRVALQLPALIPWQLATLHWPLPEELVGHRLRLEITDQSRRSAIFVDDIWVVPGA